MKAVTLPFRIIKPPTGSIRTSQSTSHCNSATKISHASPASSFRRRFSINNPSRLASVPTNTLLTQHAPEIELDETENSSRQRRASEDLMQRVRVSPKSPSYFTSQPTFMDAYLKLSAILRKYITLPSLDAADAPRIAWRSLEDFRSVTGERVRPTRYEKLIAVLNRMRLIHPSLMPTEVQQAMDEWKRSVQPNLERTKPRLVDQFGRAKGIGRRKASTARVWLVEGEGEVVVNGKDLSEAFARIHDRQSAIWPLKVTARTWRYNVFAVVNGGGTTGQAEAITLAVARALMVHEPSLKPALRRAGCITKDMRVVERKKPGKRKARKMPAWVKR